MALAVGALLQIHPGITIPLPAFDAAGALHLVAEITFVALVRAGTAHSHVL